MQNKYWNRNIPKEVEDVLQDAAVSGLLYRFSNDLSEDNEFLNDLGCEIPFGEPAVWGPLPQASSHGEFLEQFYTSPLVSTFYPIGFAAADFGDMLLAANVDFPAGIGIVLSQANQTQPVQEKTAWLVSPPKKGKYISADTLAEFKRKLANLDDNASVVTGLFPEEATGELYCCTEHTWAPIIRAKNLAEALSEAYIKAFDRNCANNVIRVFSIPLFSGDGIDVLSRYPTNIKGYPFIIAKNEAEISKILSALHTQFAQNDAHYRADIVVRGTTVTIESVLGSITGDINDNLELMRFILDSSKLASKIFLWDDTEDTYKTLSPEDKKVIEDAYKELFTVGYHENDTYLDQVQLAAQSLEAGLSFDGLVKLKELCDKYVPSDKVMKAIAAEENDAACVDYGIAAKMAEIELAVKLSKHCNDDDKDFLSIRAEEIMQEIYSFDEEEDEEE